MRWPLLLTPLLFAACAQTQTASNDPYAVPPGSIPRAFQTQDPPRAGHWETGTAPDGRQASVWVPENSYRMPKNFEEQAGARAVDPFNVPKIEEPYRAAAGRYETLRHPDGRLEHTWRPNEPAAPAQGYWQLQANQERVWIPGTPVMATDK